MEAEPARITEDQMEKETDYVRSQTRKNKAWGMFWCSLRISMEDP